MSELKPCPFPSCKSTKVVIADGVVGSYFGLCLSCHAQGPEVAFATLDSFEEISEEVCQQAYDKAVELWNRRAE